ncbi:MAG: DUF5615 family PIN-like protein [Planctomycetes bacterium]|nr:DUF5615 family PIN-like protein [Planctomycetota bacterium]
MAQIKVYLDEDVHHLIAQALELRGWEVLTTPGAGRSGSSDGEQIQFAADHGYAILSYNVADFPRLHHERVAAGLGHAGIIVATQDDPGANARAMLAIVSTFSADDLVNQLLYLNNWMGH